MNPFIYPRPCPSGCAKACSTLGVSMCRWERYYSLTLGVGEDMLYPRGVWTRRLLTTDTNTVPEGPVRMCTGYGKSRPCVNKLTSCLAPPPQVNQQHLLSKVPQCAARVISGLYFPKNEALLVN